MNSILNIFEFLLYWILINKLLSCFFKQKFMLLL